MLTHIAWWGGLIFVLGAITYKLVMGALDKPQEGIDWYRWQMQAFFLLPALVLAGYFYPLERAELQYGYLGVLGVSLVVALATLVQEITGDGPEDADKKPDPAERAGEAKAAGPEKLPQAEEDEEAGWLITVLGAAVLYSPVLVACGLGCYKAWPMVQTLL